MISWTSYNEWGEITRSAVLKCGARELDLVKEYATHDYDAVLNQYCAKARFYDADNRRFTAVDPIKEGDNWYVYCGENPINYIDPLGTNFVNAIVSKVKNTVAHYYEVFSNDGLWNDILRGIVASTLINSGDSVGFLLQAMGNISYR